MTKSLSKRLALCLLMLLISGPATSPAQTGSADGEAVIMFDFNLDRMRQNELVKNGGVADMLQNSDVILPGPLAADPENVIRIYGGMTAPANIQDAQSAMTPNGTANLPVNFFFRVVFSDKEAATAMLDSLKESGTTVVVDGKTYVTPPAQEPQNLRAHLVDDKTFEVGTTDYVTRPDRNVFTKALLTNWKELSDTDAIRISIDVAGMQGLFDEGLEMARDQAPPEMFGVIEMGTNLAGLSLGFDMDSENLLTVIANGKDADATESLKDGLNGLMAIAKMQAPGMMVMLQDDQQKKAAEQMVEALKAKSKGNSVMIKIPKPDGFEEIIGGLLPGQNF